MSEMIDAKQALLFLGLHDEWLSPTDGKQLPDVSTRPTTTEPTPQSCAPPAHWDFFPPDYDGDWDG